MRIDAPRFIADHEPAPRRVGNSVLLAAFGAALLIALVVYAMVTAPPAHSARLIGGAIDAPRSAADALTASQPPVPMQPSGKAA